MSAIHTKISLMSMYRYGLSYGIDIFESLDFNFDSTLKEKVVNRLCLLTTDYSVMVADLNWLKQTIESTSYAYMNSFERWFNALNMKYNPIENYDRLEEFDTDTTYNGDVSSNTKLDNSSTNNVNGYDSNNLVPESSSTDNTLNVSSNRSNGSNKEKKVGRIHGNIGVTTSQQMLEQEFKIGYYNIVDMIVDVYKHQLIIPCI